MNEQVVAALFAVVTCACASTSPPPQAPAVDLPETPKGSIGATTPRATPPADDTTTYEEALSRPAPPRTPGSVSLTDAQLAGPMHNATFINACGAPDDMHVTVRVAVSNGHAVGVTVATHPPNDTVARCVDGAVRRMSWPSSPELDAVVTTF